MSTLRQLAAAVQLSLGFVFLLSAVPKLRRPSGFARSVATYEILPRRIVSPFAGVVMLLEVFLVLAFLTGWWNGIALPLAAVLLLAFLGAVGLNLSRRRRVPCGCFGERSAMISPRTVARLLLLLAAVVFVLTVRGVTGPSVASLTALVVHGAPTGVLLHTIGLTGCLGLVGVWLLSLPDVVVVVRGLFHGMAPTGDAGDEAEGA